jgi:N-acetylmuramoyl-L-alanine amidase
MNTNAIRNPFSSTPVRPMMPAGQPSNPPPANAEEWQPPVAPRQVPVRLMTTWVSLDNWTAEHGIGKPHLVSNSPVTTYAVNSSNGVMVLAIGSREATWNGVEIHLGFGPQMIDGQLLVHGRDLQKNLEPLLCDPPLTLPQTSPGIVIDPGHGGMNSGTHSILDGRFEKEFTLDWARRMEPLLAQAGGFFSRARTTRTIRCPTASHSPRRIARICSSACISIRSRRKNPRPGLKLIVSRQPACLRL